MTDRPDLVDGGSGGQLPALRPDPVSGSDEVGAYQETEFDRTIEQLFAGTLADEDKYALEFECPGCGHRGTVRSSHAFHIEWDRNEIDGRYAGDAIGVTTTVLAEFWMTVDRELVDAWQGGSFAPQSHGFYFGRVHECAGGGESNDRAALSPSPPPRSSSVERAVDD